MKPLYFLFALLILSCQNAADTSDSDTDTPGDPVQNSQEITDNEEPKATDPNPIYRLESMLNFDSIEVVSIRNDNGFRKLSAEEWKELEFTIKQSRYVQGIICKPVHLALIFRMKDKSEMEGYFCSGFINFIDTDLYGSFRLGKALDMQSY